ncbi:MAG: helix-turn-helix domain-containing protein, partial [Pseudobdellovibrionaceae bacterium]
QRDQLMSSIRIDQLKEAVKLVMKKKKLTYEDLAEHLQVSLPTVKRILGPEELTLSRLLEICDWLKLNLSELESLAGLHAKQDRDCFTLEQEQFFVNNQHFLTYLGLLHDGDSPEKIATEFGLTPKSTELYLIRLERMNLLRRDSKGRVRMTHSDVPNLNGSGPLIRAQYKSLLQKGSDIFQRQLGAALSAQKKGDKKVWVSMTMLRLSQKTATEWEEKYRSLQRDLELQSNVEEKLGHLENERQFILMHMHTSLLPNDPEVLGYKTTFGNIINLEKAPR